MFKCPKCNVEYKDIVSLNAHWTRGHKYKSKDLYVSIFLGGKLPTCACGCGKEPNYKSITKGFKKYIHGHNRKPNIKFDKI